MKVLSGQSPTGIDDSGVSHKATCDLTVDQAPVVNGLLLRMTPEQVLALFPGSGDDAEVRSTLSRPSSPFGESHFVISPDRYKSRDQFAGINRISFTLLDGRVSTLYVAYNGPEYSHVDKFVAKFSEGKILPTGAWEPYVGMDDNLKILKCADFEIRVFTGGKGGSLNYVRVHDLEAEKKLRERMDKALEKATSESKPPR